MIDGNTMMDINSQCIGTYQKLVDGLKEESALQAQLTNKYKAALPWFYCLGALTGVILGYLAAVLFQV